MFFNNLEEAQQSNSTGMSGSTRDPVYVDENTGCDCIIFEVLKFKTSSARMATWKMMNGTQT
jgi:hypothetical protein